MKRLRQTTFPRLRIGIGNEFPKGKQSEFVLSPFERKEEPLVKESLELAEEAVLLFIREGIVKAMNQYN